MFHVSHIKDYEDCDRLIFTTGICSHFVEHKVFMEGKMLNMIKAHWDSLVMMLLM